MKPQREKKLEIALLKEKIERISGKKIVFEDYPTIVADKKYTSSKTDDTDSQVNKAQKLSDLTGLEELSKINPDIVKVLTKKVPTSEAMKILMGLSYKEQEAIRDHFKPFEYSPGSGGIEVFLQKLGYKLTPADVMRIPKDSITSREPDLISLTYNIFYNKTEKQLKDLIDEKTMDVIIEKFRGFYDKNGMFEDIGDYRKDEYNNLLSVLEEK